MATNRLYLQLSSCQRVTKKAQLV